MSVIDIHDGVGLDAASAAKFSELYDLAVRIADGGERIGEKRDAAQGQHRQGQPNGLLAPDPPGAKMIDVARVHGVGLGETAAIVSP
ncbi:hypothetical protein [Caulobacter sp. CCH9-E1]|uniref:hypothetical protein n=1 Tax=Caulobacter sp. CCH9-E1 TaxID=1768768 RepID=UPI0012E36D16|nr:hypothetical protein [Caulobacter sp. CCH9-E1]